MFPKINPTSTPAWSALQRHFLETKATTIKELFERDPKRFNTFSYCFDEILFDFSKNNITEKTIELLTQLADQCELSTAIEAMFEGEKINETENRAVLHTALRNFSGNPVWVDGKDIMKDIHRLQEKMKAFCTSIHQGSWKGYTGKKIKFIVNIGIGGSDLGPSMVAHALKAYQIKDIESFFVSNIDGTDIQETFNKINAEETLFIISSKTFTTQETMTNAHTARSWFLQNGGRDIDIEKHFIAISTNLTEVVQFGINPDNMFEFWEWVGGRFSLWSSIGLSVALSIGFEQFENLLKGAHNTDLHFRSTPFNKNIPILMALIGIWYRNFYQASSEAIIPYDQYLCKLTAYLQQCNMESNGKYIDRNKEKITYATGPVIWGEPGTNAQHAYFQWLHQGSEIIPCDFIAPAISHHAVGDHHEKLLSNFFAQTEALMMGTNHENTYRVFEGNRPSNSFLLKKITPYTLGQFIALYEHKIFVQGVIWNIFSFDQWGVELGKILANNILAELPSNQMIDSHDSSTNGLINAYKRMR